MEGEKNKASVDVGKCEASDKGTRDEAIIGIMVLDSDGEDGSPKTDGSTSIGASPRNSPLRPPPPFLLKTYDMAGNDQISSIVSWDPTGTSLVIWDQHAFAATVLPMYFRHNNFQSFISQLNAYGFRKISWEQWAYMNENFRKGEKHLLQNIKRRIPFAHRALRMESSSAADISSSCRSSDTDKDLEVLKKKHQLLKVEMVTLREKQHVLEQKVASLKNQATVYDQESRKRMILAVQRVLKELKELNKEGTPIMVDDGEAPQINGKGKRKLDEKSDATQSDKPTMYSDLGLSGTAIPVTRIMDLILGNSTEKGKPVSDEEVTCTNEPNTMILLEDLVGEWSDFVEFITHLKEKASNFKS